MSPTPAQYDWLLYSNDTGTSSMTIWCVMTGAPWLRGCPSPPYDAGDFGRCYRLLERFPEWRARLAEMATVSPQWRGLVATWPHLEALYRKEQWWALDGAIERAVAQGRRRG